MNTKRLKAFVFFLAAAAAALVIVQLRIAVVKNKEYSKNVVAQRSEQIEIKKHRGLFYDRNMIPLVENSPELINISKDGSITKNQGELSLETIARYGKNSLAEHLIGYVDSDGRGISGLEKCFDSVLYTDKSCTANVITDAVGNVVKNNGLSVAGRKNGNMSSVKLTLDYHIQKIVENCMDSYGIDGAAVVMDVKNSDILAMASRPQFDRNNENEYLKSDGGELVNKCISAYNAGSIFKIITASAALENNTAEDLYNCSGTEIIDSREFACHKKDGHGTLDFENAFAESCNCAFYNMGVKTGAKSIINMAEKFGLGLRVLCFDCLSESAGCLPVRDSYGVLESVNFSIGQGEILITPVQAANMACIVANNGIANSVNVAQSIVGENGAEKRDLRENFERRVIDRNIAYEIQKCMRKAVTDGTASGAKSDIVEIAGKTGTAQTGWYENGENMVHGWFCGFFPYDNPKYAMAVFAENGRSGSGSAVPVFKAIAEEIVKFYPIG